MNFYNEINSLVKRLEINKRARRISDNSDTLKTYWKVGRLLVEAQGGSNRAKYGNNLIKEWSKRLTQEYGKWYTATNLRYFRKFYLLFQNHHPLGDKLNWSHIRTILPIKDENKRNYYLNLCIERTLSKRELINEIKNDSYERLLNKPNKIELITEYKNFNFNIREQIKNPIIIKLEAKDKVSSEKDLQISILAKLKQFFSELGQGFAFIGNEYKIKIGYKNYFIDILLFNYEINAFVVVELKLRSLQKEDKAQIEFYMKCVDENLKRDFHNRTIGIIVSKEQDEFIVSFISNESIIPVTYELR